MQIRLAINRPGISDKKLFKPVIEIFMRGLPYAYRNMNSEGDTSLKIDISGNGGGIWYLQKSQKGWKLLDRLEKEPKAIIELSDDIFWKLVTDSIDNNTAAKQIKISGDEGLCAPLLNVKAVMR
jgi:hypothetical protein